MVGQHRAWLHIAGRKQASIFTPEMLVAAGCGLLWFLGCKEEAWLQLEPLAFQQDALVQKVMVSRAKTKLEVKSCC